MDLSSTNALVTLVSSICMSLITLVIYVRNPQDPVNRQFGLLSWAVVGWSISNYFSDESIFDSENVARATFIFGVAIIYTLWLFVNKFPNVLKPSRAMPTMTFLTVTMGALIVSPYFIIDVNDAGIVTGNLYPLFIGYIVMALALCGRALVVQWAQARSDVIQRGQLKAVIVGIVLYGTFSVISSVVMPLISNDWSSSQLSPIYSLFLVASIAVAIVRYQMFNVRPAVLRSMGYTLMLLLIGLSAITVLTVILSQVETSGIGAKFKVAIFVTVALFVGMSYEKLKTKLARLTSAFFYKNVYETQQVLDVFNQAIIGTMNTRELLIAAADSIDQTLKPKEVTVIRDGQVEIGHNSQLRAAKITTDRLTYDLSRYFDTARGKVLDYEKLGNDNLALRRLLRGLRVAVVCKILSGAEDRNIYVLIGDKLNGSAFTPQDMGLLNIISDEMTIAIQNAMRYEEIEKFSETLQDKVTIATRKLQRTNEKLVQLDETKDEFISMASHQLRTPLTSIKGYLSMVLEGDAGDVSPMQRKMLDQAFVSSQRMVALIADLLNVSRLRTGKFVIEPSMTNLADVVKGEVAQLKETAAGRQLQLECAAPPSFPLLYMDETKTRQVIMNFIDNAIYYTPAGGHIMVKLAETDKSIEFSVNDDGIGVPKAEQYHLFTKFYRAGNARKARPDGTGLGLFMAKKVIVAQGGAVLFKSRPGKGSTFGFTFAKAKLQPPASKP